MEEKPMTKLLLRLFVKNYENKEDTRVRARVGRLSGIVGVVCNVLLFGAKFAVGTLSGSVAVTADAMNNLSDASSSLVTFIGFKLAERPADEDHPYGHARYEYLSGLAVAVMIILIGFELQNQAFMEIIAGNAEPQGLLPMQMPKDMRTVEEQKEDLPFDMKCYKDADGNVYDYAYGLNWSGVIKDWRTEKYAPKKK
jgi:hypothetical protein